MNVSNTQTVDRYLYSYNITLAKVLSATLWI